MRFNKLIIFLILIISIFLITSCSVDYEICDYNEDGIVDEIEERVCNGMRDNDSQDIAQAGENFITYVNSPENGDIAMLISVPENARYDNEAPIVVVASTWFVEKYTPEYTNFHLKHDPTETGTIFVTYLWPGKSDRVTGVSSEGTYDYGGPDSLAALRDVILFSAGEKANNDGLYIDEMMDVVPLTDNVGLYASSHAGIVATNVLAYYGPELSGHVQYFIGRENPTRDEMYPLELGHFDSNRNPVYNPFYHPENYDSIEIDIDYSTLGWLVDNNHPDGVPYYVNANGDDYVWDEKGPNMDGKQYFSRALTQALLDNGALTEDSWPSDLATPEETAEFWPYRVVVENYDEIGTWHPDLRISLVFAEFDHVQSAPDKPHIHQAFDGFYHTAELWTRMNADNVYFLEIDDSVGNNYLDNPANSEPGDWMDAEDWGYYGQYGTPLYSQGGSYAAMAEMADRVKFDNWDDNLDEVLWVYE